MQLIGKLQQALFRWQGDGSGPIHLGQRRVFILPARGGLLFAVALIVMLVASINYNLALGHALVFLLAGLGLAGMLHTFRNLHGLTLVPGRCQPVFCGETAQFEFLLINDRPQARRALEFSASPELLTNCAVDGRATAKIAIPLAATRRGWLELPRVRLSTRYPLGLFTAWSYLQPTLRCLVYPRPLDSPLPEPGASLARGDGNGQAGQEDFAGFRERQPADSLRHVAWKASARDAGQRPLLVKQFAGGADSELYLDWQDSDPALPVESRLSQLTGWVLTADTLGLNYGLRLPGRRIPASTEPDQRQRCLEALALFQS